MVGATDIYELKSKVHKLKLQLDQEPKSWQEKDLANRYLNKVLDSIDEIRLF
jgi:PIN domain nuclease of toxin-antitoxin system